ncbi:LysR family transcriptional regulator [Nonomuraea rhodomycinica]|uniref:LysR family transcriptional regulator n=1 Tax=Nonomuraea rhodomycinica TaxID=1712872 RepID=A0A7Y6IIY2_9ACTN|nr:LysR family transcriptional regulator [Nonomuraea rhodomycinica]NUW38856.1 LysR family transcriptional regulator [Nonomuraea rhodomycinica]
MDLHPRLLRAFVAVAEELHFGRAAARLYLAQQALSRDVRRLEEQLGAALFTRSTRRVELTPAGARLMPGARRLLALHDELVAEVSGARGPLLVDVNMQGHEAPRPLVRARELAPGVEMLARFHGGLASGVAAMREGRLDVSFGRFAGLPAHVRKGLTQVPVRLDRLAVLVPADHALAALEEVPLGVLAGFPLDAMAGNPATTEWTDLGERLAEEFGLTLAAPHAPPVGPDEMSLYLRRHREPVLATAKIGGIPGVVARPLIDPVPLALENLVFPAHLRHPGLDALLQAVTELRRVERWLRRPPHSWLPEADEAVLSGG